MIFTRTGLRTTRRERKVWRSDANCAARKRYFANYRNWNVFTKNADRERQRIIRYTGWFLLLVYMIFG